MDIPNLRPAPMGRLVPTSVSIENEVEDWRAKGYREIGDFVNNPALERVIGIFGPGFREELPSLVSVDRRSFDNN